ACKYSNSVLVYSKVDIQGEYQGKEFSIHLEASLANTTIPGVRPYEASRGGVNALVLAGAGIAVVVAIIAVLLLKRH
ncbi:MAG: hypothetical protein F7C33_04110, partial [Desulfurococcales archaeon]|nr:hypothetical protein [Desulfurococcales archaeon]